MDDEMNKLLEQHEKERIIRFNDEFYMKHHHEPEVLVRCSFFDVCKMQGKGKCNFIKKLLLTCDEVVCSDDKQSILCWR